MSQALVNARILTPEGWRDDAVLLLKDAHVAAVTTADDTRLHGIEHHDLQGLSVLPGFIDCQVNGGGGVLFNATPTVEGIRTIAAAHRRFGTTALLPTLISDKTEVMRQALTAVEQALREVPGVLGIHIEGPFIAPERKGVHDVRVLRRPDTAEMALSASLKQGRTLLTVAPEEMPPGSIRELAAAGVIVAVGHTAGTYTDIRAALDAGARGFTHLYNAMTPLQSRAPGAVGAALEDRASWCGVIVDGHHVHPASLKVALAAKPKGKVFLVTDAMPPVGATEPSFTLNGEILTEQDGIIRTADGVLAGSALSMITAVRNCVELLGLPLEEAARMAATYPADFLGLGASHGRIEAGYRADLTVVDAALRVQETWIGGVRQRA